jgi:putative membrane protein
MFGSYWGLSAVTHVVVWLVVVLAIVLTTLFLVRSIGRGADGKDKHSSALDLLDERYARGEIEREEYLQRRKDILER